jgi:hypothetical protein
MGGEMSSPAKPLEAAGVNVARVVTEAVAESDDFARFRLAALAGADVSVRSVFGEHPASGAASAIATRAIESQTVGRGRCGR